RFFFWRRTVGIYIWTVADYLNPGDTNTVHSESPRPRTGPKSLRDFATDLTELEGIHITSPFVDSMSSPQVGKSSAYIQTLDAAIHLPPPEIGGLRAYSCERSVAHECDG